jgi:hypothetical protein
MRKKIISLFILIIFISIILQPNGLSRISMSINIKTENIITNDYSLPPPISNDMVLEESICRRMSVRQYSADKSLKLNDNLTYGLGVEWSKIYGGSEWDFLFSVDETIDGGFYASGTTEISNMYYGWLMKLDSKGHIEWEVIEEDICCSNLNYLLIYNTIQTSDAGFIICGSTRDESNNLVGFIIKYDYSGIKQWSRIYDDRDSNQITNILEIEDGYMVIGIESYNDDYYSPLMKIDDSGFIKWRKDFNYGRYPDMFWGICSTYDDGFLLSGTAGWGQPNADVWLVKTDNVGNLIWNKSYGGNAAEEFRPNKCSVSSDGGFIVGCESSSFGSGDLDGWIFKTDSDGNMVWNKTFGGESQDRIWGMDNTLDGGFIFCLNKNFDRLPNSEIDLIKLNSDGDVDWIFNYATPKLCMGYQVSQIIDDGFILALRINGRYGQSYADGSLVKISENINQQPVKPIQPDGKSSGKAGSEYTYSTSSSDPDGDQLYYFWDWGDGNNSGWIGPYDSGEDCSVSYSWKSNGNYSIRVKSEDILGYESEWSDPMSITMPKNKVINRPILNFLENHPDIFPILQKLLRLLEL